MWRVIPVVRIIQVHSQEPPYIINNRLEILLRNRFGDDHIAVFFPEREVVGRKKGIVEF